MKMICLTQTSADREPVWLNPMAIESCSHHKFNRTGKIETGTCINTVGTNEDGAGAFFFVEESPEEVASLFEKATRKEGAA